MRFLVIWLAVVLSGLAVPLAADEGRVALVIGNASYRAGLEPLANPVNDARLISDHLRQAGFTVEELHDASTAETEAALKRLGERLRKAGPDPVGLLYFAGHGLQIGGTNFLLATDVDVSTPADIATQGLNADDMLYAMLDAGAQINIVVLDACRVDQVSEALRPVAQRGLKELDASAIDIDRSVMIAYSTGLGEPAFDGADGNSLYARILADRMLTPGLPLEIMFRNVRLEMVREGYQKPWESNGMLHPFAFVGPTDEPEPVKQSALAPGRIIQIGDFGNVPAELGYDLHVPAARYLRSGAVPVTVRDIYPATSEMAFFSTGQLYQGRAFRPSISGNVLTQTGTGNVPASFSLIFPQPLARVRFMIPALIAATKSGITFPQWRASALAADGTVLATVEDDMVRSFVDVPEKFFEVRAPGSEGIVAIRFDSDPNLNGHPFTAFSAVLLEAIWVEAMP